MKVDALEEVVMHIGTQLHGAGTLGVPLEGTQRVGEFCGRIKGVKYRFALQGGTWDFPGA